MINLLPNDIKDDIRAARANVIIVRYTIIVVLAFLFIAATLYTSHTVLTMTKTSAQNRIDSNNENLQKGSNSETKRQVDAISTNLAQAKPVLDSEVSYSRALIRIGQLMPAGTVLGDNTFTTANFNGAPLDITAYAKSLTEATLLQSQLQAASPFVTSVVVKKTEESNGISGYPVLIVLTITLNKAGI